MGDRILNQKNREYIDTEQNYKAYRNRGGIGDRARNLVELIGAERISRRDYQFEGTCYVKENGETYDREYMKTYKQNEGIS